MYESLYKTKHLCSNVKKKVSWNTDSEGKAAHVESAQYKRFNIFWSYFDLRVFMTHFRSTVKNE